MKKSNKSKVVKKDLAKVTISYIPKKWTCDACDGNSQTGCLSSTGECYR